LKPGLCLAEAVGLTREEVIDQRQPCYPAVRFAVGRLLETLARRATWQEAACSSLTELFAPEIPPVSSDQLATTLSVD